VSDEELWTAVARGDPDSFTTLYDRYCDRIHRFLVRRVGPQDAEDLTVQVFLEAWRQRHNVRLHPEGGLAPWLFGVAVNLSRADLRQRRSRARLLSRVSVRTVAPDIADEVVERQLRTERTRLAYAALGQLAENDRLVIQLCVLESLSPSQAAAALGQRPATVRSRLTRARRRLAAAYARLDTKEGER
jgi:RNA polymerase sigma-70 factor (ECF subfamily)